MKIHQLFEERTGDYIHRLTRTLKIKQLGAGAFSTVFQHPVFHNVAVKLIHDNDPAYLRYLRFAIDHPENPWVPKVVGVNKVMMHSDELEDKWVDDDEHNDTVDVVKHIAFFQKLRRSTKPEIKRAIQGIVSTVEPADYERMKKLHRSRRFQRIEPKAYTSFGHFSGLDWDFLHEYSTDQHVREIAGVLADLDANDIHDSNVMMRDSPGGTHLVITDPVAS